MKRHSKKSAGQALVEFTLAATLIFFLVSAAVDLGLIFFSVQTLRAAAQEGATYGSYPVQVVSGGAISQVVIDYDQVVARVREAAGSQGTGAVRRSQGIVNLYDLNNNGLDDVTEGIVPNPATNRTTAVTSGPIRIDNPKGTDPNNFGEQCRTDTRRIDMRRAGQGCWIRVQITYTYRFFFPLAPAFGDTVNIPVTYVLQIRSSFVG